MNSAQLRHVWSAAALLSGGMPASRPPASGRLRRALPRACLPPVPTSWMVPGEPTPASMASSLAYAEMLLSGRKPRLKPRSEYSAPVGSAGRGGGCAWVQGVGDVGW